MERLKAGEKAGKGLKVTNRKECTDLCDKSWKTRNFSGEKGERDQKKFQLILRLTRSGHKERNKHILSKVCFKAVVFMEEFLFANNTIHILVQHLEDCERNGNEPPANC